MRIMIIMIVLVMIIIEIIIMMIKKMIIIMIRCENENPLLSIHIFRKNLLLHMEQNLLFLANASVGLFVMHFLLTVPITIKLSLVRQLKMSKQRDSFNSHLKDKLNVY